MKKNDYVKAKNIGIRLGGKKAPINRHFAKMIENLNSLLENIFKVHDGGKRINTKIDNINDMLEDYLNGG